MQRLLARYRIERVEMIDFRTGKYLYPVGMNKVKVPDQAFLRIPEISAVDLLDATVAPRDPLEAQPIAVILKQLRYGDSRHSGAIRRSADAWRRRTRRRAAARETVCR